MVEDSGGAAEAICFSIDSDSDLWGEPESMPKQKSLLKRNFPKDSDNWLTDDENIRLLNDVRQECRKNPDWLVRVKLEEPRASFSSDIIKAAGRCPEKLVKMQLKPEQYGDVKIARSLSEKPAKYAHICHDLDSDKDIGLCIDIMMDLWDMPLPSLLIEITGSAQDIKVRERASTIRCACV